MPAPLPESTVPRRGLAVVAGLAHRLPVAAIPEQLLITAVRDPVIHHRRRGRALATLVALFALTERVLSKPRLARPLPRCRIATLMRRSAPRVRLPTMHLASPAARHERPAARKAAGSRRGHRHVRPFPSDRCVGVVRAASPSSWLSRFARQCAAACVRAETRRPRASSDAGALTLAERSAQLARNVPKRSRP